MVKHQNEKFYRIMEARKFFNQLFLCLYCPGQMV